MRSDDSGNNRTDSIKEFFVKTNTRIKRSMRESDATSILIMNPILAIFLSLCLTIYLLPHSGVNDCRDGYEYNWCSEESALNVNGDMEVYLPTDNNPDSVKNLIAQVEDDWTTNVMVIYVESEDFNVTQINILKQIDLIERELNPVMNDQGEQDNVIYVLSISTVIKEVNSSGGRVVKAFFSGLAESTGNQQFSDQINDTIDSQSDIIGNYAIPDEQDRIDQILQEMPQNALDKLVRDVGRDSDGDGIKEAENAFFWNRGVIIIGISDDLTSNQTLSTIISQTQEKIDAISIKNNWMQSNLTMTLTGPAPLTNAVTEESFKLFWSVFPVGVVAVALTLFTFHCDLLQTGRIRWIQGIKVLIISLVIINKNIFSKKNINKDLNLRLNLCIFTSLIGFISFFLIFPIYRYGYSFIVTLISLFCIQLIKDKISNNIKQEL